MGQQLRSRQREGGRANRESGTDRPTGTRRRAGGHAGEGSITGSQACGSGDGDRGADRPAGTGRQAGGQTGEGSLTGRVEQTKSIGSCGKSSE